MKNANNLVKGFLVFAFLGVLLLASPASAENEKGSSKAFLNARASLKAESMIGLESAVGVVLGPNNTLRVMGAEVDSVSGSSIKASAPFGQSELNFEIKVDADSKLNGKVLGSSYASKIDDLKAGDKISFGGSIVSSTSSLIVVDGDHLVSRALFGGVVENKTFWRGEVKAVNASENYLTVKLPSDKTVRVNVSSSTVITVDGVAKTLSAVEEGDEVGISGTLNSEGSVITASKLVVDSDSDDNDDDEDEEDEDNDDNDKKENENRGGFWGKIRNWFWK